MCWPKRKKKTTPPVPTVPAIVKPVITEWYQMSWALVKKWTEEQGLHLMNSGQADILVVLDSKYWYTTPENTALIIYYIYDTAKLRGYTPQRFDCDDFAIWLKAMFSLEFGHNSNGFTIGRKPGPHAYNSILTTKGWDNFEPQQKYTREMFPFNGKGYKAEAILI